MEDNKTQPAQEVTPLEAFEFIFEALEKVAAFPLPTARMVDEYAEKVRKELENKAKE